MRATARVQPNAECVPCHKEIICSEKASALIRTGHLLMMQGAWTAADLTAWNGMLDAFILQAQAALEAGPLSPPESASPVSVLAAAEDSPTWFRDGAAHFAAFVEGLPEAERAEALRAGRNALDRLAVEINAARQGVTVEEVHRRQHRPTTAGAVADRTAALVSGAL